MKFLSVFLLALFLISAKPGKEAVKSMVVFKSPVGLWIGTYTAEQVPQQGELYYSFVVKPDNTLVTESRGNDNRTYYCFGKWEIKDSLFIYELEGVNNGIVQRGQLKISNCNNMIDGRWQDVNNRPSLNGRFPKMFRQPAVECDEPCYVSSK